MQDFIYQRSLKVTLSFFSVCIQSNLITFFSFGQSCFYTAPKRMHGAFRQEIERMTGPVPSVREP